MTGRRPGADHAPAPGVADRATGEIRILAGRCTTCVLNPARTAIPLPAGRRAEFVREARDDEEGYVVCHQTIGDDTPPGTREAICRGYADAYGLPPAVQEALDLGIGHLVEVPEPAPAGPGGRPSARQDGTAPRAPESESKKSKCEGRATLPRAPSGALSPRIPGEIGAALNGSLDKVA
ncbi:hypothetical protein [Streptomyces erythrochromogenes]|uniref:hypothetical protein n=1 Tax=Streptomyces erythrochromogenes TaxID=285574 RepID=UPI00386B8E56|nr:hypothetical protein OG489_00270 [Streptomyces erythrochromogenes]WSR88314.1 hypothetical protein OG489_39690 [Streptomyces erythrochromogenes]